MWKDGEGPGMTGLVVTKEQNGNQFCSQEVPRGTGQVGSGTGKKQEEKLVPQDELQVEMSTWNGRLIKCLFGIGLKDVKPELTSQACGGERMRR